MINPGYSWNNRLDEKDAFLNWQLNRFYGRVHLSQYHGEDNLFQSFVGYGEGWALSMDGNQNLTLNSHEYDANWLYKISEAITISQGGKLYKVVSWQLPHAYTELNWHQKKYNIRTAVVRQDDRLKQLVSVYWYSPRHRISTSIDLDNYQ